jgi:hypothetical protein
VKLAIVTGFHEYLLPRAVDHGALARLLQPRLPGAVVPVLRWHIGGGAFEYHRFLFDREFEREMAIDLFLEFAADAAGPGHTVVAMLPHESALGSTRDAMATHVDQFVTQALRRFDAGEILRLHLYLSDNAQAVLTRLHALHDPPAGVESAAHAPSPGDAIAMESFALDSATVDPAALDVIRRNYRRAVLVAAERLVSRDSVFVGAGRGDLLDELFADDGTVVPSDAPPDEIVTSLRPGGRLFELLTRPVRLPAPAEPDTREGLREA